MNSILIAGKKYNETSILEEREEYIKLEAVDLCFALKTLSEDKSDLVRAAVARKKVGHDVLVNDDSWRVRATVAKYTDSRSILDKLIDDKHDFVRFIVVKRGHALAVFVNDSDEEIASIARYEMQNQR